MKKALVYIGISSSVVTTLINLLPEDEIGLKILLFIIFGATVYGISWAKANIDNLFGSIVLGVIIGACLGIISGVIDHSASEIPAGINRTFLLSFKWILPILAYTYFGVDPWKN